MICKVCSVDKEPTEFYAKRGKMCKPCSVDQDRTSRAARKLIDPWAQSRLKYNLSPCGMTRLRIRTMDRCSVCNASESVAKRKDAQLLAVDHDHSCCPGNKSCGLCVRGLLCQRCNLFIGQAKDSPELLRLAASYLENTHGRT